MAFGLGSVGAAVETRPSLRWDHACPLWSSRSNGPKQILERWSPLLETGKLRLTPYNTPLPTRHAEFDRLLCQTLYDHKCGVLRSAGKNLSFASRLSKSFKPIESDTNQWCLVAFPRHTMISVEKRKFFLPLCLLPQLRLLLSEFCHAVCLKKLEWYISQCRTAVRTLL